MGSMGREEGGRGREGEVVGMVASGWGGREAGRGEIPGGKERLLAEETARLPRRGDMLAADGLEPAVELTCTRDLAAREAGEGMALVAAVRASKSKLSRLRSLRSSSALDDVTMGVVSILF